MGLTYRSNVDTFTKLVNSPISLVHSFFSQYLSSQGGPLTNPVWDFLGWEKVPINMRFGLSKFAFADLESYPADWHEIEYLSAPGYIGDFYNLLMSQPRDDHQYASTLAALVAPLSRGNVRIKSADTDDLPLNYQSKLAHLTHRTRSRRYSI